MYWYCSPSASIDFLIGGSWPGRVFFSQFPDQIPQRKMIFVGGSVVDPSETRSSPSQVPSLLFFVFFVFSLNMILYESWCHLQKPQLHYFVQFQFKNPDCLMGYSAVKVFVKMSLWAMKGRCLSLISDAFTTLLLLLELSFSMSWFDLLHMGFGLWFYLQRVGVGTYWRLLCWFCMWMFLPIDFSCWVVSRRVSENLGSWVFFLSGICMITCGVE